MKLIFHFRNTIKSPRKLSFMKKPVRLEHVGSKHDHYSCSLEDIKSTERLERIFQEMISTGIEMWIDTDLPIQSADADQTKNLPAAKDSILDKTDPRPSRFLENAKDGFPITDFDPTVKTLGIVNDPTPKEVSLQDRIQPRKLKVTRLDEAKPVVAPPPIISVSDLLTMAREQTQPPTGDTLQQDAPAVEAVAAPEPVLEASNKGGGIKTEKRTRTRLSGTARAA